MGIVGHCGALWGIFVTEDQVTVRIVLTDHHLPIRYFKSVVADIPHLKQGVAQALLTFKSLLEPQLVFYR